MKGIIMKNKKMWLIGSGILLILVAIIGSSYAYWRFTYIAEKANYFRNFSKRFSKYSGKGAVNSIYSPVDGCTNPKIMA